MAAAGDVFLATVQGRLFNQVTLTTFPLQLISVTGPVTDVEAQSFVSVKLRELNGLTDRMRECCPVNWVQQELWVQKIRPVRIVKHIANIALPGARAATTATNLASVITRRGAVADAHNVGSVHLPLGTTDCDTGLLLAGVITQLENLATKMRETQVTPNLTFQFGHEVRTVTPPLLPVFTFRPTTSTIVQPTVRTERGRTVGKGI